MSTLLLILQPSLIQFQGLTCERECWDLLLFGFKSVSEDEHYCWMIASDSQSEQVHLKGVDEFDFFLFLVVVVMVGALWTSRQFITERHIETQHHSCSHSHLTGNLESPIYLTTQKRSNPSWGRPLSHLAALNSSQFNSVQFFLGAAQMYNTIKCVSGGTWKSQEADAVKMMFMSTNKTIISKKDIKKGFQSSFG